ncbi:S8 family serine peptidase, partial [bacterium]|nr:S8 family serine peptidase [bacterium]
MKKLKIIISLLILGLVGSLFFIQKTLSRQNEFPFSGEYTQNELLVKFKDESSAKTTLLNIDNEDKKVNSKSLYKIKTQENQSITNLYQSLKNNPTVDYIEPNYIVKTTATPNDTNYASQWNLPKISAPSGWDKSQGSSSVVVGVIDTGIDYSHEDLSSKIWNNPGETGSGKETNGLDDDGNGYIDDFRGWDFVTCDLWNSVSPFQCLTPRSQDNNATDDEKHGTSVTGIIGASTNNSLGVAGIGWNVKVVPLKVLNGDGDGTTAEVVAALDYARIKGIPIVNMSLGSTSGSVSLENAVVASYNSGVTMIAATGNDYSSSILYPAKYPQVLAVGATDQSDVRASFSNYGPEIDVVAPGVSIWSTDRMGAVGY